MRARLFHLTIAVVATASLALSATAVAGATVVAPRVATIESAVSAPTGAHDLGPEAASATLRFDVYLNSRDAAALTAFAAQVTARHTLTYGHYLAPGAFAARFGASGAAVESVVNYLQRQGLTVAPRLLDGLGLTVTGPAGAIDRAFATTIDRVRLAGGAIGSAAVRALRVPVAVAPEILGVVGLDNVARESSSTILPNHLRWPSRTSPGRSFSNHPNGIPGAPTSCPSAVATTRQGYGGITDDQVATAYGVDPLYSAGDLGAGQTVAIFELEPFAMSDVAAFDTCYFGTNNTANISVTNIDGGPGAGGGSGESALDIENVSALAPDAHIDVVQAPNTTDGVLDDYATIVAQDTAKVVTTSWGECEAVTEEFAPTSLQIEHLLFEQAAAQGQTVFAAAGDSGSDDCSEGGDPAAPYLSVDDPASQPYVVGAGGTTAITVTDPPTEQAWNDGAYGGATGGGPSSLWPMTPWQSETANATAVTTAACGTGTERCRVVPDVSAFADEYTGITIYIDGAWYTIGGTSSAAPIWAAMLAEVNASNACTSSESTAHGVGFAAPLLYQVGNDPGQYADAFNDVTTGNNDIFSGEHGKYSATVGYDAATGWGSPDLAGPANNGLAAALCGDAQADTLTSLTSISPSSGTDAGGTAVTITGQGFMTGTTDNVSGVAFGDYPAASFHVVNATTIDAVTPAAGLVHALRGKVPAGNEGVTEVTFTSGAVAVGPTFSFVHPVNSTGAPTVLSVSTSGGPIGGGNTVQIYGTGFTGATGVTFGGVRANSFTVKSDALIQAVVPAEGRAHCVSKSHTTTSGLCQTTVVVTTRAGSSATDTPLPPLQGEIPFNITGIPVAPKDCHCELYPTPTEYDFQATPHIRSITNETATHSAPLSNPTWGSGYLISGTGFNWLTLNDVTFGDPTQQNNQDAEFLSVKYNGIEVYGIGDPTPEPYANAVAVRVQSQGGSSAPKSVEFGAIPKVTGLSSNLEPSAGGTTLTLTGQGFTGTTDIEFASVSEAPGTEVLKNFTVVSDTDLSVTTPSLVPGDYVVLVDTPYGDSETYIAPYVAGEPAAPYQTVPIAAISVAVTYPGGAALTGSANTSCSTSGGCTATLTGVNLGAEGSFTVYFGTQPGTVTADVTNGDSSTLTVTVPPSFLGLEGTYYIFLSYGNGVQTPDTLDAIETYY